MFQYVYTRKCIPLYMYLYIYIQYIDIYTVLSHVC